MDIYQMMHLNQGILSSHSQVSRPEFPEGISGVLKLHYSTILILAASFPKIAPTGLALCS
jgi:hypothetical protein